MSHLIPMIIAGEPDQLSLIGVPWTDECRLGPVLVIDRLTIQAAAKQFGIEPSDVVACLICTADHEFSAQPPQEVEGDNSHEAAETTPETKSDLQALEKEDQTDLEDVINKPKSDEVSPEGTPIIERPVEHCNICGWEVVGPCKSQEEANSISCQGLDTSK